MKTLRIICNILLAVSFSFALVACGDDEPEVKAPVKGSFGTQKPMSVVDGVRVSEIDNSKVTYTSNGALKAIASCDCKDNTITAYSGSGKVTYSNFVYNDRNYLHDCDFEQTTSSRTEQGSVLVQYFEAKVTKLYDYLGRITVTYKDGDKDKGKILQDFTYDDDMRLTRVVASFSEGSDAQTVTVLYNYEGEGAVENKYRIWIPQMMLIGDDMFRGMAMAGFLGRGSTYLPTSIQYIDASGEKTHTLSYKLDSKQRVVEITCDGKTSPVLYK